jgi:hypothetical protein
LASFRLNIVRFILTQNRQALKYFSDNQGSILKIFSPKKIVDFDVKYCYHFTTTGGRPVA